MYNYNRESVKDQKIIWDHTHTQTHIMTKNALISANKALTQSNINLLHSKAYDYRKKMFPWREWKKWAHAAREGMERKWGKSRKGGWKKESIEWHTGSLICLLKIQTHTPFIYLTDSLTNVVYSPLQLVYKPWFECTENTSFWQGFTSSILIWND